MNNNEPVNNEMLELYKNKCLVLETETESDFPSWQPWGKDGNEKLLVDPKAPDVKSCSQKIKNALFGNDAFQKNKQDIPGNSLHTQNLR